MSIGVLGPLTVNGDTGAVGPRDRIVLAALAVHRGEVVRADTLADALWGERPPASASKVVQGCVARLRKALGAHAIETVPHGYRLVVPADSLDAARFERLVLRGQELLSLGEADRAAFAIDEALSLWRGKALTDLDGWQPGRVGATRLEELRLDAEELLVDARLHAGRFREVLTDAHRLAAAAPLRERRWAQLALAQYQAGRQADALATIRRARRVLAEELGLDPGPGLVTLEDAILRQDPSLVAAAALPEPSAACPYLGLVPYDLGDSDLFFGRDADVSECVRRLADEGVLVVVGPSGSGKSSLVRAGVAAALQRDGARVVLVTPGARPTDALAAIPTSGRAPVLVVDQCEEAVTLCRDADEQAQFFAALPDHAERAPLVVALRADRLGEMSAHPSFARLIERGLFLVRPMDEADLRAAIEGPARQAGLLLEPGLVDLLVRDVEGEPGALPLLSHALRQTWERREDRTLTVAGYQASGGIRGAVAKSAEAVYEQAPPEQRPILRDLLLRLVAPSPEGEPVRSRVPRRVVAADAEHEHVVEQLVKARLIISDEEVVEIAHEALARAWPRLRSWLDDDVEGQRIWRHLAVVADSWDAMRRPASELYRGGRLVRAIEWCDRAVPDLNQTERAFLEASQQLAEAEQRAAEEQARRQVRINRRLRVLVAGVALLAVAAAAGGLAAVRQAGRADAEADVARSHELAASAISVMDDDPSLAKLLAVASATDAVPTLDSISALHRAWDADKVVARYTWPDDQTMFQLRPDLDLESQRMVVSSNGDYLEVVDMSTGERLWGRTVAPEGTGVEEFEITNALITDGGGHVVAGQRWFTIPDAVDGSELSQSAGVNVRDAQSGQLIERFDLGPCGAALVTISEPYAVVKTLSGRAEEQTCQWEAAPDLRLELLDTRTGDRELLAERSLWIHSPGWGGAFSGDRRYLAFDDLDAGENGGVVVLDMHTGERSVLEPSGDREELGVRAMNSDGSLLLYGDLPMQVWDVARDELVTSFDEHGGDSLFGRFANDGSSVYSTGVDGVLRHWDARTGRELAALSAVGHGPVDIVDDGLVLVPSFWAGEAALIDFNAKGETGVVGTCQGTIPANTISVADGLAAFLVRCGDDPDGTTYAVSLEDSEVVYTVPGHQAEALAISPDGTRFVRQDGEGTLHGSLTVRDLRTGELLVELDGLCTWDADLPEDQQEGCREYPDQPFGIQTELVRWSPDGSMIAAAVGAEMAVWDSSSGRLLFAEAVDPGRIFAADAIFTPDSQRLVVSGVPDGLRVLSTVSGKAVDYIGTLRTDGEERFPSLLGYSPDETTLLAVGGLHFIGAAGELNWIDAQTYELVRTKGQIHDGHTVAAALSPDRSRIATGSADGFVRVWDAETGELVHEVPLNGVAVHGVAFVDEFHLAITPADGNLLIVTTDPHELVELVRGSLTRGFRPTECERFNFGDNCPTLAELRGDET